MSESASSTSPPVWGLVLAGGSSRRMGRDKTRFEYHGRPQVEWAYELLVSVCARAYVSIGPEASTAGGAGLPAIRDCDPGLGPAAGLLAAWEIAPDVAWLALAADMPLVDRQMLATLIAGRDPAAVATAFRHADGALEPLCTIWEPKARAFVEAPGSLRRVLEKRGVRALQLAEPDRLASANTLEEYAALREKLNASRTRPAGADE